MFASEMRPSLIFNLPTGVVKLSSFNTISEAKQAGIRQVHT